MTDLTDKEINRLLAEAMGYSRLRQAEHLCYERGGEEIYVSRFSYKDPAIFAENMKFLGERKQWHALFANSGDWVIVDSKDIYILDDKDLFKAVSLARIAAMEGENE